MSARRTLITALFISLLGHLIIFTTFSVANFSGVEEKVPKPTSISFLGEVIEKRAPVRVETIGRNSKPRLQPIVREPEIGPSLSSNKPRPTVPAPKISVGEIISLLEDKEAALLKVKVSDKTKKSLPEKLHLLEKEREK